MQFSCVVLFCRDLELMKIKHFGAWSLLLVGIGQLGAGRRERLISISITVAIIIIMIINVIIITIVTTIITIIGVGELGERERVYLGKQKLFQLIYQII